MPCSERAVYHTTGIMKNMSKAAINATLSIPLYMEYLKTCHIAEREVDALFYALSSARTIARQVRDNENLIILGNFVKDEDIKFDLIFNFQDPDAAKPYDDTYIEQVKKDVKNIDLLEKMLYNLYCAKDSKLSLCNYQATAKLLSSLLKIKDDENKRIEEIINKYNNRGIIYVGEGDGEIDESNRKFSLSKNKSKRNRFKPTK